MRLSRGAALALSFAITVHAGAEPASRASEPPLEVVVEGDRGGPPAARSDPSAASSVISREALETPGADAADVLGRVPGVQLSRHGASADLATASIRGATSAQTPIYLAGIRLNDDVTGTADLSSVPLFMLDRVEVFRGNAPERADRLGVGGAIFFEPRRPRRNELGAGAEVGSFGRVGSFAGAAVSGDDAAALVGVRRMHADDDYEYLHDNGTAFDASDDRVVRRPNADSDSYDVWTIGRVAIGAGGGRLTTVGNVFTREQGVTGDAVVPALDARAHVQRLLWGLAARLPCSARRGPAAAGCELELTTSLLSTRLRLSDPANELALGSPSVASSGERVAVGARSIWRGRDAELSTAVGQELERLRIDQLAAASLRARRSASRVSAFGRLDLTNTLELNALGSLTCHGTSGPDGSESCGSLPAEGRLGARIAPVDQLELLANIGRYARVPTLGELYGVSALVRGNPDLVVESGVTLDAGLRGVVRGSAGHAWLDGFVFARRADDLIGYRRAALGYARPYNLARVRVLGAELATGAELLRHVRAELALTMLDPRDTSDDRQLQSDLVPFVSRLVAVQALELFRERAGEALERIGLGARLSYRSSRTADPAGLELIDEQFLLDFELAARFWQRRLGLRLALENALDGRHYDAIGFPRAGRSVHAAAELWVF
jgi:vitamin B12 transporter